MAKKPAAKGKATAGRKASTKAKPKKPAAKKPAPRGPKSVTTSTNPETSALAARAAEARKVLIDRAGKDAELVKVITAMSDAMILGLTDSIAKGGAPDARAADRERSRLYARAWKGRLKNPRQCAFLAAFAVNGGFITHAAETADIDRRTHYGWLESDADYKACYEEAAEVAADLLEAEAHRRAVEGLVSYKFTKFGDPIIHPVTKEPYYELSFSDALIIKRLEARRPELYRRKQLEVSGPNGAPLGGGHRVDLTVLDDKELALYEALVKKMAGEAK